MRAIFHFYDTEVVKKHFTNIKYASQYPYKLHIIISVLQMGKHRHEEAKLIAHSHAANECCSWENKGEILILNFLI